MCRLMDAILVATSQIGEQEEVRIFVIYLYACDCCLLLVCDKMKA